MAVGMLARVCRSRQWGGGGSVRRLYTMHMAAQGLNHPFTRQVQASPQGDTVVVQPTGKSCAGGIGRDDGGELEPSRLRLVESEGTVEPLEPVMQVGHDRRDRYRVYVY